ncbi:hypothetical protein BDZ88DRAFT_428607 [Geranomyces variabilis]|nr:hypothetical protein BDZ88DRAFT_428607 [Geranomyces variabilis]
MSSPGCPQSNKFYSCSPSHCESSISFSLDLGFNHYTFHVNHGAKGRLQQCSPTRQVEDEQTAFLVGYIARTVLFLASDVLSVVASTVGNIKDNVSFSTLTIWACSMFPSPIKPYLICTDMARICAFSVASICGRNEGGPERCWQQARSGRISNAQDDDGSNGGRSIVVVLNQGILPATRPSRFLRFSLTICGMYPAAGWRMAIMASEVPLFIVAAA